MSFDDEVMSLPWTVSGDERVASSFLQVYAVGMQPPSPPLFYTYEPRMRPFLEHVVHLHNESLKVASS